MSRAPWWDELNEYPSPLDVNQLRTAATALLAALRRCMPAIEMYANLNDCEAAFAAIAKAEGR